MIGLLFNLLNRRATCLPVFETDPEVRLAKPTRRKPVGISVWFDPNNTSQNAVVFRELIKGPQTGASLRAACAREGNAVNDIGHRISDVRRAARAVGAELIDTPLVLEMPRRKGRVKRFDQYHLTEAGIAALMKHKPA